MSPEEVKKIRNQKIIDNGTLDENSVPLAILSENIILNNKIELLTDAVSSIPKIEFPEPVKIPDFPNEIQVSNLPEVQKVEITNLPNEKDDKETIKLLQEILAESKKKEEYAYDIEIDPTLKEQLKGKDGENGSKISPDEIVLKLESLKDDDRLDVKAIKGIDDLLKKVNNNTLSPVGIRWLSNLLDTNIQNPTTGEVLKWDGQNWINSNATSGVSWGEITGTLSDQTDLQSALDSKVSESLAIAYAVAL